MGGGCGAPHSVHVTGSLGSSHYEQRENKMAVRELSKMENCLYFIIILLFHQL